MRRISEILKYEQIVYYQKHPVDFVEDYIFRQDSVANGGKLELSDHQKRMLNYVANNRRTAIKSGHGVGKSSALVFLTIWWMCVFAKPRVVAVAPTKPQLQSVLWPELALWLNKSSLKHCFELTATRLYLLEDPKNSFAEIRTASKEESLAGIHTENLLLMMDESPGIDDSIHIMLQGSMTRNNNKIIQVGNPIRTSGYFYDAFHKYTHRWITDTFNSEDSPLVDKEYIKEMEDRWGRTHNIFRVKVLGEFPLGDPDSFIPLEDVSKAIIRGYTMDSYDGIPEIGVDVARKGDDLTVICSRIGHRVLPLITKEQTSTLETVSLVIQEVERLRSISKYNGIIKVKVDDTGVGGGVTDGLTLERNRGIEVIPCNFGGAGDKDCANEGSAMWFNVKNQIHLIGLPDDKRLAEELAGRRWELSTHGKIQLEPKKLFKKEFKISPDRADALVLCFANKQNPFKILKNFDYVGDEVISPCEVYHGQGICSLYYSPDVFLSAIWAYWNGSNIIVTDEFVGNDGDVVDKILMQSAHQRVVGSQSMFNKNGDDMSLQYMKYGIMVEDNYNYDEMGAIRSLENLTRRKTLKIVNTCTNMIKQLKDWTTIGMSKKDLANNFGLCYALLNIISLLYPQSLQSSEPTVETYTSKKSGANINSGFMSI